MHIALVTHKVDSQDGQGRVNYEIARAILDKNYKLTIVAEKCATAIAEYPNARFIQVGMKHLRIQLAKDLYFAWKSSAWIRKHRGEFNVIQANGFVMWEPADVVAVHFVHSCWLANEYYPYTWSSFKPMFWYQRIYSSLHSRFEKKAMMDAKKLAVVSPYTGEQIHGLGVPSDRIVVVLNGVDTEEFHPGPSERQKFGLPADVVLGLFVGDIKTPRKNLETALKAMINLPRYHLVVAGSVDGSPYPKLADELKIADRVHFIGKTAEIAKLMRSVDLFVFPSRYEAHPLVLMEAMASGIPVVVSGNFGAAEYVGPGGQIFDDPNDVAALAKILRNLIGDADLRRRMGKAARETASSMQWKQTAEGYLKVYEGLSLSVNRS